MAGHRSRLRMAVALGALGLAALATVWLWPDSHHRDQVSAPAPVNAIAQNLRVCLLADGSTGSAQVWRALQRVAGSGNVNVQELTEPAHTSGDPGYLNGLIEQRCKIVLAVGDDPSQTVTAVSESHPDVLFATNTTNGTASKNLKRFRLDEHLESDIRTLLGQMPS